MPKILSTSPLSTWSIMSSMWINRLEAINSSHYPTDKKHTSIVFGMNGR